MLYSEASSPWRHLDKFRAIVCFLFFYSCPSVVQSSIWENKEKQQGKVPFWLCFFMSADEVAVINTFFDGTFVRLDCWQGCQCNLEWTESVVAIDISHKEWMVAFHGHLFRARILLCAGN